MIEMVLCVPEILPIMLALYLMHSFIRGQPIMLSVLPVILCCCALKIHLLCSILCPRTETVVRPLCF